MGFGRRVLKGRAGEAAHPDRAEGLEWFKVEPHALCTVELGNEEDIRCGGGVADTEPSRQVRDLVVKPLQRVEKLGFCKADHAFSKRFVVPWEVREEVPSHGAGQLQWLDKAVDALDEFPHLGVGQSVARKQGRLGPRPF